MQDGRMVVRGLAAGGESGVAGVLDILSTELDLALLRRGCGSIADVRPDLLGPSRVSPGD